MANIKTLGSRGGAVIRIINKSKTMYDLIVVENTMDTGGAAIVQERIPETDKSVKIKLNESEMNCASNGIRSLYIEGVYKGKSAFLIDEFIITDIPRGGDGTWHYYSYIV